MVLTHFYRGIRKDELGLTVLEIKGFIGLSLSDWDGKLASVIFLPGCNLRCPFCYNVKLVLHPEKLDTIPVQEVLSFLKKKAGWVEGVVLSGGEPTIHADLPDLCVRVKQLGMPVKLDTNGLNPSLVETLIREGLVDYVAMDVKAPLTKEKYSRATGLRSVDLESILRTIDVLRGSSVDYEFRTTLVPTLHGVEDVASMCRQLGKCRKLVLQRYMGNVETLDPSFQGLNPFTEGELEKLFDTARRIVPNTVLR